MHVRAMFQPNVNDAHVGVCVSHIKYNDAELWGFVSDGERRRAQCERPR